MTAVNNNKILLPLPKELDDLLDTWVTGFVGYMKVCELPPKIMEIAKKHNLDSMTIRNTIITKLTRIGISKRTIERYMPKELRLHKYPEGRGLTGFANMANQEDSNKQPSKEFVSAMDAAVKKSVDYFKAYRALLIKIRELGMKEAIAPKQLGRMELNRNKLPFNGEPFQSLGLSEFFNENVMGIIDEIFFDEEETDRFIIRIQNEDKQLKDKLATLEAQLRTN